MPEEFVTQFKKLEFREIVLTHLRRILDITTQEFKGGYWKEVIHGNFSTREYVPNSRKQYIQAIESLSDVLLPFFDEIMNKKYSNYEQVSKKLDKDYEKKETIQDRHQFHIEKVPIARMLFRDLNLLLHRIDYLKSAVYSEGDLEEEEPVDID